MKEEVYNNGISIPSEIKIFYSKRKLIGELIISVFVTSVGIFTVYEDLEFYIGYFIIIAGIYLMYEFLKKIFIKSPLLIIDNSGITTVQFGNFSWNAVTNIYVERRRFMRQIDNYLVFVANDTSYEIYLNELNIFVDTLEKYIEVYKDRNKNKNTSL